MRTKLLLLIAVLAISIQLQSNAAITVEQATSPAYMKNSGYSSQTSDIVTVSKARANGEEYYTADETAFKNQNKFSKFWRKFYVYTDPAAEDYSFYHHNTDTTPSYTDL